MTDAQPAIVTPPFNSREFQQDLHANYRRLRESNPVHYDVFEGVERFALFRYEDVAEAFRDPRFAVMGMRRPVFDQLVASGNAELANLARMAFNFILLKDPPDHGRIRELVNSAFTPRVVRRLREGIARRAHERLDRAAARGQMELVEDFAVPVSIVTIAELLGVPAEDREQLKQWSSGMAPILDRTLISHSLGSVAKAVDAFAHYFRGLIEKRRIAPGDDLMSAMIAARDRDGALSDDELVANCVILLAAGHETVTNLIGSGALALLRHPDQRALLREDPGRIVGAVEELLRFEPPVQRVPRVASETLEIDGHRIAANTTVDLVVGSANRDPARFRDPDELDILRQDNRHLSFGAGIHFCIGGSLARLEAQVALGAFLERFPAAKLAAQDVEWHPGSTFRGPRALPVVL